MKRLHPMSDSLTDFRRVALFPIVNSSVDSGSGAKAPG